MTKKLLYRAEDLHQYMVQFFTKLNVPEKDARIVADILLSADLRGVDSHGIIRLHTYYGNRLRNGLIDPLTPVSTIRETPTTLALDAGNGMGQVASYHAMLRCIEKANEMGIAMVTVRNSNHYGIAGYYAMMALKRDMIGISFTNSQPLVAPTYGRTAMLGTNPIAVAVPAFSERPFVLDMATSIVPIGRVTVYEKAGKQIPAGWGINSCGKVTVNPSEVLHGGALMPLGGTDIMRGYKGYGLAMMVDIFSGVLSGSAFGADVTHPSAPKTNANVGHFFAAINIEAFRDLLGFKQDMDALLQQMKNAPKSVGQDRIYIHGEKEFEREESYRRDGIPMLTEVVKSLEKAGHEIGIEFTPQPIGAIEEED
jgi:LDH2 family malate/lactate/ureidoglycolate dehydrogenase